LGLLGCSQPELLGREPEVQGFCGKPVSVLTQEDIGQDGEAEGGSFRVIDVSKLQVAHDPKVLGSLTPVD
jgi:hypothetical protein